MAKDVRILIVDDDSVLCDLICRRMERMGATSDRALNAEDAMKLLAKAKYDLVITVIYLPKMSGLELLEEVKKRDPRTQVIIITGGAAIELALDALDKGAFAYLSKPFDHFKILDHTVKQALRFRQLLLSAFKSKENILDEEEKTYKTQDPDREDELAKELLQVIQHLPDAVLVVAGSGEVLLANPSGEELLAKGWNVKSIDPTIYKAALKGRENGGGASIELDGLSYKIKAAEMNGKKGEKSVLFLLRQVMEEKGNLICDLSEPIRMLKTCLTWLYGQRLREKEFRVIRKMAEQVNMMERMQLPDSSLSMGVTGMLTRDVKDWSEISQVLQDGPH